LVFRVRFYDFPEKNMTIRLNESDKSIGKEKSIGHLRVGQFDQGLPAGPCLEFLSAEVV
jgi:hypothetical protein